MQNIDDLQTRFGIPGYVAVDAGKGGLARVVVSSPRGEADVYLNGAHVTHFKPASSNGPVLFLSEESKFAAGKAIRGGVPICFPWFGPLEGHDTAPSHGFARTSEWTLLGTEKMSDDSVVVRLGLDGTGKESAVWPHAFRAVYTVMVGTELRLSLKIEHVRGEPFLYEAALHSYFAVADVKAVSVTGLASTEFIDKTSAGKHRTEGIEPIRVSAETDRVYLETDAACEITDPLTRRVLRIEKKHSGATVVWNPWTDKAKALADLGDDEWRKFLCIESANIGPSAVILRPGESHEMSVTISETSTS